MSSFGKHSRSINYTLHNKITLVRGGKHYFKLLENLISQAKFIIHIQVYIFNEDETGERIINALLNAAKRGVAVFVVLDGYASRKISNACIENLKSAGINFRWFNPVFKSRYFYFGRRLHHKVVVADAAVALVGGINISNRYNDFDEPAWFDFALHVHGDIAIKLNRICADIWTKSRWGKKRFTRFIQIEKVVSVSEYCMVRARVNDWVRGKNQISKTYINMLNHARHNVIIISSYFLPGLFLKKRLAAAVKRGVTIEIIVAGVSDVLLAKQAERHMYNWLFKNNIVVYEYRKTVLHAKLSVCDKKFVTTGSYNINNVSAYASIELNLDVLNACFAEKTEGTLRQIIRNDCIQIEPAKYNVKRTLFDYALQRICYDVYRLILYLFTFYFKRRHG